MAHNHQDSTISKSSRVRFTHHTFTWLKAMQEEQIQNFSCIEWPSKVIVVAHATRPGRCEHWFSALRTGPWSPRESSS